MIPETLTPTEELSDPKGRDPDHSHSHDYEQQRKKVVDAEDNGVATNPLNESTPTTTTNPTLGKSGVVCQEAQVDQGVVETAIGDHLSATIKEHPSTSSNIDWVAERLNGTTLAGTVHDDQKTSYISEKRSLDPGEHLLLLHVQSLVEVLENNVSPVKELLRSLVELRQALLSRRDDAMIKKHVICSPHGGIIATIFPAMQRHIHEAKIQKESSALVLTILQVTETDDDASKHLRITTQDMDIVLKSMKVHNMDDDSASAQEQNCALVSYFLSRLAPEGDEEHKKRAIRGFVRAGAIYILVDTMERHSSVANIQIYGCDALCQLVPYGETSAKTHHHHDHHTNRKTENCPMIAAVISGMQTHGNVAAVQEKACILLGILADNDDSAIAITKSGGVSVVVAAMERFENEQMVLRNACRLLKKLSCHEINKVIVGNTNGISSIIHTMQHCKKMPCIQKEACATLCHLARGNSKNKLVIGSSCGISAIIGAMSVHKDQADVQEWGCAALRRIATNNDESNNNKSLIVQANGISLVVAAMQQHVQVSRLQEEACGVLKALTVNDENIQAVCSAGGIEAIMAAMERHKSVSGVQAMACATLYNLACSPIGLPFLKKAEPWSLLEDAEDEFPCLCGNHVQYVLANCDQL